MKHQLLITFAAPFEARDGKGLRLCSAYKEVPEKDIDSHRGALVIANFVFQELGKPSVASGCTTYHFEPAYPVGTSTFTLQLNSDSLPELKKAGYRLGTRPVDIKAGVLEHGTLNLIKTLERTGYHVWVGNRKDGGFKPNTPMR